MQYSVPQFVEIEDKIIGPLTLKQFLTLLAGGLLLFFFWSLFKTSFIFFILALPTLGFFGMLAFGRFNGRPLVSNIMSFLRFYQTPKDRIFIRVSPPLTVKKKSAAKPAEQENLLQEEKTSRLKRLAYLLDQKTAEEERLIHSGRLPRQWLNQI